MTEKTVRMTTLQNRRCGNAAMWLMWCWCIIMVMHLLPSSTYAFESTSSLTHMKSMTVSGHTGSARFGASVECRKLRAVQEPSPALSRLMMMLPSKIETSTNYMKYTCGVEGIDHKITMQTSRNKPVRSRDSSSRLYFSKNQQKEEKEEKKTPATSLHHKIFQFTKDDNEVKKYLIPLLSIGALVGISATLGHHFPVNQLLEDTVDRIAELGPYGYLYFSLVYIAAELLAIPAMPLTASSGYLFGLLPGTLTVLTSATIAAAISFFIGRTFLRGYAQEFIEKSPKWKAVDKAIAKEGFKVILLLRLSPLLPFALSNYLYAVTSVDFA